MSLSSSSQQENPQAERRGLGHLHARPPTPVGAPCRAGSGSLCVHKRAAHYKLEGSSSRFAAVQAQVRPPAMHKVGGAPPSVPMRKVHGLSAAQ
eukprot:scaffold5650_cov28-Tisochrysis_lutea.AAC.1